MIRQDVKMHRAEHDRAKMFQAIVPTFSSEPLTLLRKMVP